MFFELKYFVPQESILCSIPQVNWADVPSNPNIIFSNHARDTAIFFSGVRSVIPNLTLLEKYLENMGCQIMILTIMAILSFHSFPENV